MPVNRGPGVRQTGTAPNAIGTTPKEHRLALAGQYAENAPGVPRSGLLVQAAINVVTPTAATGTMTYLVAEVAAVIGRGVGDGVYTPTTVGATIANRTVATANSPASGSRWDLVWIKQNDQEKGDANNEAILGVTSGTAAASPVRPTGSVPAGAMVLTEHQIFSGTASTTAAPNTTTQLWRHTAARGAPIPVRTVAERAEITLPGPGQSVVRLDLFGQPLETYDGTAWVQISGLRHAEYMSPTFATPAGSGLSLGGPSPGAAFTADSAAMFNNLFVQPEAPGRVKILQAGNYALSMSIYPTVAAASFSLYIQEVGNGKRAAVASGVGYGEKDQSVSAPNVYLVAGSVVEFGLVTSNSIFMNARIKITKVQ